MKAKYETSTKARQWAKHLRPWGKAQANRSTRRINHRTTKKVVAQTSD